MESFNPSRGLRLPAPRLALQRRIPSDSSEASHASNISHTSEDQFVFSPVSTPAGENPPSQAMTPGGAAKTSAARDRLLLGKENNTRPQDSNAPSSKEDPRITSRSKTKPIAIELSERIDQISASSKPPEPLSARGDIPGGYFPLHEDPQSRIRIPHPFHPGTGMTRHHSLQPAAESSKSGSDSPQSLGAASTSSPSQGLSNMASLSASPFSPVSSYNPIGAHNDVGLPLGKYYPSNWERQHGKTRELRPPAPKATAAVMKSESHVPMYHGDHAHARPGSEAKRRLQQYQRDMVAQASMAARAILASTTSSTVTSPHSGPSPTNGQFAANFLKTHKPPSPRLLPLGSPGPVTPMSLEGDNYMAVSSPMISAGMEHTAPDGVGKGWHRKDACCSPIQMTAVSI